MAERFCFMPLGLVPLAENLSAQCIGYLGATLPQVFTRACGANVSLRDVTIAQIGNGATECGCRHAPEDLGILKRSVSWVDSCRPKKKGDFRLLAEALLRVRTCWWGGGGRWKSQNKKMCICLLMSEPLNSKVIKSFVPELRGRYEFFVFRDSYVLCIYVMNILCTFPISI